MEPTEQHWYDLMFENRFMKLKGTEFQNFFADIMEGRYPGDFQRVRPWGRSGDRKNDGYLRSRRELYQVYAPNEMSAKDAIDKIDEDFNGALPYWQEYYDIWYFVHNDRSGLGPEITHKLLDLEAKHKPLGVRPYGYSELLVEVRQLCSENLLLLFGAVPTADGMRRVGNKELITVLSVISQQPEVAQPDLRQPPQDKIALNALSADVASFLLLGMRKTDQVKKFFKQYYDPQYGDKIAVAFQSEYLALKSSGLAPDQIFAGLIKFAGGASRGDPAYESAVLALVAYLFEECEIFERVGR
ncbi:MAG: hypothetical protein C3F13_02930 [Anaerolineales bacterium]|nr:MAG: hypothetical protein C3F13_02930 [Anaerolineales bacterium]